MLNRLTIHISGTVIVEADARERQHGPLVTGERRNQEWKISYCHLRNTL
jgi:hypothetical protein